MAKKTRPSFSPGPTGKTGRAPKANADTAWVYRTDGAAPAKPARAAASPKARSPRSRKTARKPPARAAAPARARRGPAPAARPSSAHYEPARGLVRRYAAGSAAAGLVPIPLLDLAAVAGVHMLMVRAVAAEYGVPFEKAAAKAAIAAIAGSTIAHAARAGIARSALRLLPGLGSLAAVASLPASAGASTYLIGRIVIAHFESGGGLHDLDADAAARHADALNGTAA